LNRPSFSRTDLEHWFVQSTGWTDAVLPDYAGGSILNLPASVLAEFAPLDTEAPASGQPLRHEILPPHLLDDARVIVMLVVDGLGRSNLRHARQAGLIEWLDSADHVATITSVFPSTTVAALTSLQTALPPATHGLAGYTIYLEPQQATVNMITWKASGGMQLASPLPDPKRFLDVPNIYTRLAAAGVEAVIVSNKEFADSALTNIQSPDVPYIGHRTMAEMAGLLAKEVARPGRRFIFGYWDGFDTLAHTHGPASDIAMNELYLLDQAVGRGLLRPLAGQGTGDVAVLVVSDHGHAALRPEKTLPLNGVLSGRAAARPIPTGDRRATGLPFSDAERLSVVREIAGGEGVVVDVQQALARGLYGPGPQHPDLQSRIGESLLLSTGNGAFVYPQSNNPTAGGHGSLTSDEMLVPLLFWRF
jgi:hypothetical protein